MKKSAPILFAILVAFTIVFAIYVRLAWPCIPFFHGDSDSYLRPVMIKRIVGEWHKYFRPMQYLYLLYFSLSDSINFCHLILVQHLIGIFSGIAVFSSFMITTQSTPLPKFLTYAFGISLLYVCLINPNMLYYEHLIAPESFCMAIMSLILLTASLLVKNNKKSNLLWIVFVFFNLYISNPMPKLVFASCVIVLVSAFFILQSTKNLRQKASTLLIPFALYFVLVFIPEKINKIDSLDDDRTNIEWKQMAYTHFNLLIKDTTSLPLSSETKISLIECFKKSQKHAYPILGFNSDELMWGNASALIEKKFLENKLVIYAFYKNEVLRIVKVYPSELIYDISKQIVFFYFPNKYLKKYIYNTIDLRQVYESNFELTENFDKYLQSDFWVGNTKIEKKYLTTPLYAANFRHSGFIDFDSLPLIIRGSNSFYYFFDYLFFISFALFFVIRFLQKKLFEFHLLYLIHFLIFCYVATVGIVHTLDINRFIITIFPLLILSVFLGWHYILASLYSLRIHQK